MNQMLPAAPGGRMPVTVRGIRVAGFAAVCLGAAVTLAAFVHAAGWPKLLDRIALVPFGPYALLCVACLLARSRGRAIANLVVAVLATLFAAYVYGDLIFLHPGSMNGLAFFCVPLCQFPAAVVLLLVLLFTRRRNRNA